MIYDSINPSVESPCPPDLVTLTVKRCHSDRFVFGAFDIDSVVSGWANAGTGSFVKSDAPDRDPVSGLSTHLQTSCTRTPTVSFQSDGRGFWRWFHITRTISCQLQLMPTVELEVDVEVECD